MLKIIHLAAALALTAAPLSLAPGFVETAEAANKKPIVKRPPKPPSSNGVCWHWSHGKWTAHPC
ncbi:MAG: hypothetical protein ACRCTI_12620 [Beijerinckiaceae bacterium]